MIVPALIVAILCGALAAAISGFAGFGWLEALVSYWVAGNIALMVFVLPRLLAACPEQSATQGTTQLRPVGKVIVATGWVTLGLAMVFWQTFNSDAVMARASHPHEIGAVLGLSSGATDETKYISSSVGPPLLRSSLDHLLRIDLWVVGIVLYMYGTMRLMTVAVGLSAPPGQS